MTDWADQEREFYRAAAEQSSHRELSAIFFALAVAGIGLAAVALST